MRSAFLRIPPALIAAATASLLGALGALGAQPNTRPAAAEAVLEPLRETDLPAARQFLTEFMAARGNGDLVTTQGMLAASGNALRDSELDLKTIAADREIDNLARRMDGEEPRPPMAPKDFQSPHLFQNLKVVDGNRIAGGDRDFYYEVAKVGDDWKVTRLPDKRNLSKMFYDIKSKWLAHKLKLIEAVKEGQVTSGDVLLKRRSNGPE